MVQHVKLVQQSQDVTHVLKQPKHVQHAVQDIIYQVDHVFFVQVKSPTVQHVHLLQLVPPVLVDIIQVDPHVLCVHQRNVQVVMPLREHVPHVNLDIICQVVLVQHVQVK